MQGDDQNFWNFAYLVFFAVLFAALMWMLVQVNGRLPERIALFDLVLLILATFRLVRLFVYDKIMEWFRGAVAYEHGPLRTASDLLNCPWCFGIWAGTFVAFFYFLIPDIAWFPILVLAIAGVGSFIQLAANMVGWNAERSKVEIMKNYEERSHQ